MLWNTGSSAFADDDGCVCCSNFKQLRWSQHRRAMRRKTHYAPYSWLNADASNKDQTAILDQLVSAGYPYAAWGLRSPHEATCRRIASRFKRTHRVGNQLNFR
jgi:hypothetical protein